MNQPNLNDPALCEECGLRTRRGALAVCNECCEKAWLEGQSNIQPAPAKPPFFLWDFRSRKVCCGSFFYGGFMFISLTMLVMSFLHWNLDYLGISLLFMLASTTVHKTIPLSGKDKE